jgi:HK97 family phage portal protein
MGLLSRVEQSALRANMPGPFDDFFRGQSDRGQATYAGLPVSPDVAMRVSVVHACIEVLSMTLASLSLRVYKNLPNGGNERAIDHPLYPILSRRPNSWQTRFEFIEYQVRQLFLRGNAYAEKDFQTLELVPLHPDRVRVEQLANRQLRYRIKPTPNIVDAPSIGPERLLSQEQMLHIRDASDDAIAGQARTVLAREAIAVAAAAERFSGRWLQNDGSGRVMATHPARLDPTTRSEFHRVYQENAAGWANRGKLLLAEGGVKYEILPGLSESGFLTDPRKFQLAEICRYFGRVPPFMIGHEDKTTWGTNIEQIKGGFVAFCAKPIGDRIEQALMRDLLAEDEQEEYFIAFDYAGLLRGDLLSVVQAIAIERQQGLLNANEGRALLNMNPREDPGGDVYQQTPPSAAPNPTAGAVPAGNAPPAEEPSATDEELDAAAIPAPLLADAAQRIAAAEVREVEKHAAGAVADPGKFVAWAQRFYTKHRAHAAQAIAPFAVAGGFDVWAADQAAERIERTALSALAAGVPDGWAAQREGEIAAILDETFTAAAALSHAA